jgi:hypothetical protein
MGIVTAETPLLAEQGRMYTVFGKGLVEHLVVTTPAELVPFSLGLQCIRRARFSVALIAHTGGNRLMNIVVKDPGHIRAVRIMTTGAIGRGNRIIHMLLGKDRAVGRMASDAECIGCVFQQEFTLCRRMRFVAGQTTLFHGIMLVFILGYCSTYCLVTVEAKGVS